MFAAAVLAAVVEPPDTHVYAQALLVVRPLRSQDGAHDVTYLCTDMGHVAVGSALCAIACH